MNAIVKHVAICGVMAAMALPMIGCETKAQTGALVGAGGGAAVGGAIGSFSHARAGEGALIGGAVGAVGGYIVGNEMDKKDQRDRDRARDRVGDRYAEPPARPAANNPYVGKPITRENVITWTQKGVKDDVIIQHVQDSGTVFHLTAADENDLRDANVSEDVIRAMKDTGRQ
jgi:uncharacterized protein YcfJ